METTTVLPHPMQIRGHAFGVTMMALFAVAWVGWGLGGHLPPAPLAVVMVAAAALSAAMVGYAWRLVARTPTADTTGGGDPAAGRKFGLIVAAEWIGLGIISGVLGATGHADAIPAGIAAGVGLHFFPLARLFDVRVYRLTGAVLLAGAAAGLALGPWRGALWTLAPGLVAAVALYATCVARLGVSRRYAGLP